MLFPDTSPERDTLCKMSFPKQPPEQLEVNPGLVLKALQPEHAEVVFAVASVARSSEVLRGRGCPFLNEAREVTAGSWAASFVDPDGHRLTLFGPK